MDPSKTLAAINHNPLNLRPLPNGEKWQGQTGVSANSTSGRFCQFKSNVYGVRAAVINMRSIVRMGRHTLRDMINTWAPSEDNNDPRSYAASVASFARVPMDYDLTPLFDNNPLAYEQGVLVNIVRGMNLVEAGGPTVGLDDTYEGVKLALNLKDGYIRQDDGNIVRENVKDSSVVKAADNGLASTGVTVVTGIAVPLVSALAGAPPITVAILVGAILLVGLGIGGYFLFRARSARVGANNAGVA
jgi:hypothetical protein